MKAIEQEHQNYQNWLDVVTVKILPFVISSQHYLKPVEVVGEEPDLNYKGKAYPGLADGYYVTACTCHPEKEWTTLVLVQDGLYYESYEIRIEEVQ